MTAVGWALWCAGRRLIGLAGRFLVGSPLEVICGDMTSAMGRVPATAADPVDDDDLLAA
jgi:hypothetical protein